MDRSSRTSFSRALATIAVTAAVGAGTTACATVDDGPAEVSSSTTASTTPMSEPVSSAPVPGPADTSVDVPAPVAERWTALGGTAGSLGPATGPATEVEGGSVTDFERGSMVLTPEGRVFVVQGEILRAYREAGGPAGRLGFPTSDETTTDGGWISTFTGGTIAFLDGRPVVEVG